MNIGIIKFFTYKSGIIDLKLQIKVLIIKTVKWTVSIAQNLVTCH